MSSPSCPLCGGPLPPPSTTGRPRRWCSSACRNEAYRRRKYGRAWGGAAWSPFPTVAESQAAAEAERLRILAAEAERVAAERSLAASREAERVAADLERQRATEADDSPPPPPVLPWSPMTRAERRRAERDARRAR